jgi:hypothetical protein
MKKFILIIAKEINKMDRQRNDESKMQGYHTAKMLNSSTAERILEYMHMSVDGEISLKIIHVLIH